MKNLAALTVASLLSILFMTFHLTDDILHHGGTTPIEFAASVLIPVVWLYGTLVLAGRPAGYIIITLASLLALTIPVVHILAGAVINGGIAKSGDPFFFVWTIMALSVTATFSLILSLLGLWTLRRGRS
jgi:hypothetical protein